MSKTARDKLFMPTPPITRLEYGRGSARDKAKQVIVLGRTAKQRQKERATIAKLLAEIKAKRLYHLIGIATWSGYVRDRWGRSRRWADQIIQDHGLSTAPTRLQYGEGAQIGRDLARIQRTRSYRGTNTSFAAYVREIYDRPVGWAYRRIAEYKARTTRIPGRHKFGESLDMDGNTVRLV